MKNNSDTPTPIWRHEADRIEAQCDDRHQTYSNRLNRIEARQQQLYGDPETRTPGVLKHLQDGIAENKLIGLSTKKEIQGLKLKLAALMALIQALGLGAFQFFK